MDPDPAPIAPLSGNAALAAIGARYQFGDRVRHATDDPDDGFGVVVGASIRRCGVGYTVAWGRNTESVCDESELEPLEAAGD